MATYVQFGRYGKRRKGWSTIVFPHKKHRPSELVTFVTSKDRPGHYAFRVFDQDVIVDGMQQSKPVRSFQFYFTDANVALEFKLRFG